MRQIEWNGLAIPADGEAPDTCAPRQMIEAMTDVEFARFDAVLAALPPRKRKAVEVSQAIDRLHPDTVAIFQAAGISDDRRDDIYRVAQFVD